VSYMHIEFRENLSEDSNVENEEHSVSFFSRNRGKQNIKIGSVRKTFTLGRVRVIFILIRLF